MLELNISGNLLDDLPDTFSGLTALTSLLASHNRFPYLPPPVGACSGDALTESCMRHARGEDLRAGDSCPLSPSGYGASCRLAARLSGDPRARLAAV